MGVFSYFLNTGIGLLAFTLGLASLGTNSPALNASLSLIVIILVRINGASFFPREIQRLRKLAKTDSKAKIVLDGLESKHFGFKSNFTKYHLFAFGLIFLIVISVWQPIAEFIPAIESYVGI